MVRRELVFDGALPPRIRELTLPATGSRIPHRAERTFSKSPFEVAGMEEGRSLATRRCILEAAQRLFASHGYHGASIRDIVQACGVSNAALYYHFGSKQSLYFEVLREYIAGAVGQTECRHR